MNCYISGSGATLRFIREAGFDVWCDVGSTWLENKFIMVCNQNALAATLSPTTTEWNAVAFVGSLLFPTPVLKMFTNEWWHSVAPLIGSGKEVEAIRARLLPGALPLRSAGCAEWALGWQPQELHRHTALLFIKAQIKGGAAVILYFYSLPTAV